MKSTKFMKMENPRASLQARRCLTSRQINSPTFRQSMTDKKTALLIGFVIIAMIAAEYSSADQKTSIDEGEARHFTLKVLPLLKDKCLGCHGADVDDLKGDYDVRTRESLLRGGESGEAAVMIFVYLHSRYDYCSCAFPLNLLYVGFN